MQLLGMTLAAACRAALVAVHARPCLCGHRRACFTARGPRLHCTLKGVCAVSCAMGVRSCAARPPAPSAAPRLPGSAARSAAGRPLPWAGCPPFAYSARSSKDAERGGAKQQPMATALHPGHARASEYKSATRPRKRDLVPDGAGPKSAVCNPNEQAFRPLQPRQGNQTRVLFCSVFVMMSSKFKCALL